MNFATDLPANAFTTGTITIGDPVTSQLETGTDTDWFRVDLVQGQRYVFDLGGIDGTLGLTDPLLRLYQNGQLLAEDEDGGPGAASRIVITAPQTGSYHLEAASPATQTGRYQLSATNLSQPTGPRSDPTPVDAIDWGTAVATNSIDVYFAGQGEAFAGHTSFGWTAYEIQQTRAAMAEFEAVADITFNRVYSPDDADFKLVIASPVFFSAAMYPPGEANAGIGIFSRASLNADGGFEQGGAGFRIMLHELAHGLGLAHPHDEGGDSHVLDGVTSSVGDYGDFDLNQGVFTTLSYNYGYRSETGFEPSRAYGKAGTLSPLDIALIQERYGARQGANEGATTYDLTSTNGSGTFYSAIWDTGGTDWIAHDGPADATIDLRAATLEYEIGGGGFVSRVEGVFGGVTIAHGVVIENARSGRGADTLIGNDVANRLLGGAGDDRLTGGLGNDILTGGAGADTFVFGSTDDGAVITDFDDADSLEFASASQAATVFASLSGAGADATLTLNGSTISLRNIDSGSLIQTGHRIVIDADAAGSGPATPDDGLVIGGIGHDALSGGAGNDVLLDLGGGNDTLRGAGGDDQLQGGAGGDLLDGGSGIDTARYNTSDAAVTVNLGADTAWGGHAAGDRLDSIEHLVGSRFGDTLIGDGAANRLDGFSGDDLLRGGEGADILFGSTGFDTADYSDSTTAVNIGLFRIGSGGTAQGDILNGVEAITGSNHGDTLIGAGYYSTIRLDGGDGDDLLFDYGGRGILNGGGGNDIMVGRLGADAFDGGTGTDVVRYSDAIGAVYANLQTGFGAGADAQGDTYVHVENVVGSRFFDTLIGDDGDNRLEGLAGRDTLIGGNGDDQLFGGSDLDTFVFTNGNWGNDIIHDFDAGPGREKMDLSSIGIGFSDLSIVDTVFGVRVEYDHPTYGIQTIALGGVDLADITADDFIFAV